MIVALFPLVATFAVYAFTAAPSIYPGDSPEFTTASHVLGIPHPPGYAHYVFLGKIGSLLPLGNIAFRLNLLSALGSALASAVFALLVFRWTGQAFTAVAGSLLMAFSVDLWAQSGSAEVYTIHVACLLLLLFLGEMADGGPSKDPEPGEDRRNRALYYSAAFLFGYALGIHYFILFALPGGLYLFARKLGLRTAAKSLDAAILAAVAGWVIFLLLPLRAATRPPLNWGDTFVPFNFFTHIFWSQYAGRPSLSFSWLRLAHRARDFVHLARMQWPWPVFLLLPPGGWFLWRKRRADLLPSIMLLIAVPAAATLYLLNDPSREIFEGISSNKFLSTYALFALLFTLGACQVWEWTAELCRRFPAASRRRATAGVLGFIFCALIAATLQRNWKSADRSSSLLLHAYSLNLIEPLPAASGLATEYDVPTFPLLYFRFVEELRPDVTVYGRSGILFQGDYNAAYSEKGEAAQERARKKIDDALARRYGGRMFFSNQVASFAPESGKPATPFGLLYASVGRPDDSSLPDLWSTRFLRALFRDTGRFLDHRNRELVSDMYRMSAESAIARSDLRTGGELLAKSIEAAPDYYWINYYGGILRYRAWKDTPGAEALLLRAAEIIPSEEVYGMLGVMRYETGDIPSALRYFRMALDINPEHVPSLMNSAECHIAEGNPARAEELIREALKVDPGEPNAWLRLGQVQGNNGKFSEAERSFSRAIELSPTNGEAFFLRAVSRMGAGKKEEAASDLREAAKLSPGKREFYERLTGRKSG